MPVVTNSTTNIDGYIDSNGPDTGYFSGETFSIYNFGGWQVDRPLLRFTLPSYVGVITKIRLFLYAYDRQDTNNTSRGINVHQLTRTDWTNAATWNQYKSGSNWTAPGGDYNATVVAYKAAETTDNSWSVWTIQGVGATNGLSLSWGSTVELLLKASVEDGNHDVLEQFCSSRYSDSSKRPYLEITYEQIVPGASVLLGLI